MKINIDPHSSNFMKGQDFNGGVGIGGIVKILMEARGMKLGEIKEMFGTYLDHNAPQIVRDNGPVENPFQAAKHSSMPTLRLTLSMYIPMLMAKCLYLYGAITSRTWLAILF